MKRLLIVADNTFAVQGVRTAFRHAPGFKVIGFVDCVLPPSRHVAELKPDVVVIDAHQESEITLARMREIAQHVPKATLLLLTMNMDQDWLNEVSRAGASAAFSKMVSPQALVTLVKETCDGHIAMWCKVAPPASVDCPLTDREIEILRLVAQGYTNGRIARQLWITEQTVKFHLSNTYRKLGVENRTEASRYAHTHDLMAA